MGQVVYEFWRIYSFQFIVSWWIHLDYVAITVAVWNWFNLIGFEVVLHLGVEIVCLGQMEILFKHKIAN